jgi:pimeloyl-ACP methyl ester carboxylesterase
MLRDSSWSRAEIEAWGACKPLVDRAYVRRGLYLGDGAWEELFDALAVPTLLLVPPDSPMGPRQEAVHNDLVRTVVVPGAGHSVRRDQPAGCLRAVDAFLAEAARA